MNVKMNGCVWMKFMTQSSHPVREHILDFDDDFDRTLRRNRNQQDRNPPIPEPEFEEHPLEKEEEDPNMAADNRTIKELSASGLDNASPLCIQYPMAALGKTDEFELKSSLLHHISKFHSMSMEEPNKHLKEFEVVCSSMTPVNVDGSILKMKAFPFSLLDKAQDWLYELAPGTVTSWESMKRAFLEKFFPTSRVILLRKRISGIQQNQELLPIKRQMLDTSAERDLVNKTPMAAKTLIANRALNAQQYEGIGQMDIPRQQVNEVGETIQISSGGSPNNLNNKEALCSNLRASIPSNTHQHKPHNNLPKTPQGARKSSQSNAKPRQKSGPNGEANWADCRVLGQFREQGKLPSSTVVNPNGGFESAKAMSLRNGKQVGSDPQPSKSRFNEDEQSTPTSRVETPLPQVSNAPKPSNSANKGKEVPILINSNIVPPNVPFPRRFMQSKKEETENDILETFRKVQVNIPLLDAIKQVPRYAKFLKELCTTRKRISSKEVVKVNHLIFPADFYVLEMAESDHSPTLPILLGQPFMKTARTKIDVFNETLTIEFDGEVINFNLSDSIKYPSEDYSCFSIDVFASLAKDHFEQLNDDALELVIARGMNIQNNEAVTMHPHGMNDFSLALPSNEDVIEMPPTLELKPLPSYLKYVFFGNDETLPVIISSTLTAQGEDKLVRVLREYKTAIGWTLADIKGISPTTCMHRILLEDGSKTSRDA
ncbi:unnamed protein product [Malus baccata var. baccata]